MTQTKRLDAPAHASPEAAAADRAARAIPPAWPLAATVAVNPFLGQSDQGLAMTAARLARVAGVRATLPRSWFRSRMAGGGITDADLSEALAAATDPARPPTLSALKAILAVDAEPAPAAPTVADLAARASGLDWPGLVADRIGAWAAGYFDQGQALWAAPRGRGAYAAWRAFATYDLTPEIIGLPGFATTVSLAPEHPGDAIVAATRQLGLSEAALETYFHGLLISLAGWAQHARYLQWQAELGGGEDDTVRDLLAIRLVWDAALQARYGDAIDADWRAAKTLYATPLTPSADQVADAIAQEALERGFQRGLTQSLAAPAEAAVGVRPALQAAFCIDVRSEVYRRALEAVSPDIETLGFAGFFGLPVAHRRWASDVSEAHLPVLLSPSLHSCSGPADASGADGRARIKARAKRAWGRFKLAAVSSFAFVEATGPVYAAKLLQDAVGAHPAELVGDPAPRLDPPLDLETRIATADTVLRAMSLTAGFARLVLIAGHGAGVVNNPHASGLQCGACGGYSGEVNARLLAALLNDPEVRDGLARRGVTIPEDTLFVAALHDTTADEVTLFADDAPSAAHRPDLDAARRWLEEAGVWARGERALRLQGADAEAVRRRGRDWAQLRPEWGLAGCGAFIAAPRRRTAGRSLQGRVFLHSYDWRADPQFSVLELILTAPVVVASWISLQYYGSTVAPQVFGGGDKLLHNVTGGMGVIEGNGGSLRTGLPWQSVHDGEDYAHEPLRLSVCVEAPKAAVTEILARHPAVRALCDNRWIHLLLLDEDGRMAWRYAGDLAWTRVSEAPDGAEPVAFELLQQDVRPVP